MDQKVGGLLRQDPGEKCESTAGLPLPRAPQRPQPRDLQDREEGAELRPLLSLPLQGN